MKWRGGGRIDEEPAKLIARGGGTRSERVALDRAAQNFELAGRWVVVCLWNDRHTGLTVYVARPDAKTRDGRERCTHV